MVNYKAGNKLLCDLIMADSKKQKPSTAKSSKANPAAKKTADKSAATNAKTTTKQSSAPAAPTTTTKETTAKATSSEKTSSEKTSSEKTSSEKTSAASKATDAKKVEKPVAKAVQKPAQKEKRSGGGVAFLALLCSLGALGLSGYNYYEQNLSPKKAQSQEALLSGVNDIKGNVTEFSGVVTSLQQDVQDFKDSQSQYITKDTLDSVVKESVDNAVANLPDLPQIGPVELNQDGLNASSENSSNEAEGSSQAENTSESEGSSPTEGSSSAEGSSSTESSNTDGSVTSSSAVESTQENSSDTATNDAQNEEDSAWSWGRAKQDFKAMVMGFITIKKTDQGNN